SRNSASNFRLFSAMTPNFPCSHGLYATRGRSLRGAEALASLKQAQLDLLKDPEILLMQLQVHAAAASPQQAGLAKQVRRHWCELRSLISAATGATQDELDSVLGQGALISALAAVDLPPSRPS
ncbi:hypothetical protein ABZ690_35885, partial [Streptomyces sp. NPDC006967]